MASPGQSLPPKKDTVRGVTIPKKKGTAQAKHLRHFILFLIGADCVALFIYLLIVPTNAWDSIESRLHALGALGKSIGTVAASVLAYFGLKGALRKYLTSVDTIFDEVYFASVVCLVTLVIWGAVLPIWSVELQVDPPPSMQPKVLIQGKVQALNEVKDGAKKTYVLEGLLLRPYEVSVEGAGNSLTVPLISVLKGSLSHRPLFVQLPCSLEVSPRMPGAEVWIRRTGEDKEKLWGTLPSNGRVELLPGSYDVVKFKYENRVGSGQLEMHCPTSQMNVVLSGPEN